MENINIFANKLLAKIKEYDRIIIYRHESPDFDALGSQFGLYNFLKDNFKNKEIFAPGFSNVLLAPNLYPSNDAISDKTYAEKKFLAICLDCANFKRVSDQNYLKADYVIKIDHHPAIEQYGDINYVDEDAGSCAEIICEILFTKAFKKYSMNKEAAKFFYSGIVGDTGRFQFPSTSSKTLFIASKLIDKGFSISEDVYYPMYVKDMDDFERQKVVMNNYKISDKGVAYYILSKDQLKKMNLDSDEAKVYLSLFQLHEGIKVWCCFAEDEREHNYRGSLRSRVVDIDMVARNHGGGGHKQASGCRPTSLKEIKEIIKELDEQIELQGK